MKSKIKTIMIGSVALLAMSSANAAFVNFDDDGYGEIAGGVADTLVIEGIGITGSLSNTNLTNAGSFSTAGFFNAGYSAYLDAGSFSGLGVYDNTAVSVGSDDGLQSNHGGNINRDEVLIFDFTVETILNEITFNGDHVDKPDSGAALDANAIFNVFYSADGINFTSALTAGAGFLGNYAQLPVGNDESIVTGAADGYQYWAVAATGWSSNGDTSNIHSSYLAGLDYSAVPAPATLALFGLGLLGMGMAARRKNTI